MSGDGVRLAANPWKLLVTLFERKSYGRKTRDGKRVSDTHLWLLLFFHSLSSSCISFRISSRSVAPSIIGRTKVLFLRSFWTLVLSPATAFTA